MTSLIFVNDYDMLCAQDMQWYVTVMSCDPSGTLSSTSSCILKLCLINNHNFVGDLFLNV